MCLSAHSLQQQGNVHVQSFFAMSGLKSSVTINHHNGHFFGPIFTHNTSWCVALDNLYRVWLTNKTKKLVIYLDGVGAGNDKNWQVNLKWIQDQDHKHAWLLKQVRYNPILLVGQQKQEMWEQ